jgi:hypothetical protein
MTIHRTLAEGFWTPADPLGKACISAWGGMSWLPGRPMATTETAPEGRPRRHGGGLCRGCGANGTGPLAGGWLEAQGREAQVTWASRWR